MTKPNRTFWVLCWVLLMALVPGRDLYSYYIERTQLQGVVDSLELAGKSPGEAAALIQHAVRARTSTRSNGLHYSVKSRPKLRHTAWQTWQMAEGQCGEGARLIVNLLQLAGVPATRVNLTNSSPRFYHTAVAYQDKGEWWFLDTINSSAEFLEWSRLEPRAMSSLVSIKMHHGGALLISSQNPYFERYSYAPWTRILGKSMEVNQFIPLPQWLNHILENPNLILGLLKMGLIAAAFIIWQATRLVWRFRRRHRGKICEEDVPAS